MSKDNSGSQAAGANSKIKWYTLAFMAFSTVWGFGNVTNGFGYFHGTQVIFSWIMVFVIRICYAR